MSLIFSRHNIFSGIPGTDKHFILNLLSGSADILDTEELHLLEDLKKDHPVPKEFYELMAERGYISDPAEEQRRFRSRYLDFLDDREKEEVQIFFVPDYSCNFACSYCYQDEYHQPHTELSQPLIDAFFTHINTHFAGRKKYLTIFGGEPLLNSPARKSMIGYFLEKSRESELEVCVVTNGYALTEYVEILQKAAIREIQVTLDGVGAIHDQRRYLKGGGATFEKIVGGIDAALAHGFPVNLRMVIDRENIDALPELARFAIDKGWTANPLFNTQFGRNYELHHCQTGSEKLFSRISLYEAITRQIKDHPYILDFHRPAYSVTRFLTDNGNLPDPLFDACPACKSEWAFDYTGKIYSCTATVGKPGESLGTFFPEDRLEKEKISEWEDRDVTSIPECRNCNVQLACGGGCGSVAKNRNGSICTPDCRPIRELLELGFTIYQP